MELPDELQLPRTIWKILFWTLPEDAQKEMLSRLPIRPGDILTDDLLQKSLQAVKAFDERLDVMINYVPTREAMGHYGVPPVDASVNFTIYDPAAMFQRIRIEAGQQAGMLRTRVMPAGQAAAGTVQLAVLIGKDGTVLEVSPLAGPEPLIQAAMEAVSRWRYRPTRVNGIRMEVKTTVELDFTPAVAD